MLKHATMYETSLAADSISGDSAQCGNIGVAEWMSTLASIRQDKESSEPSDIVSVAPKDNAQAEEIDAASPQHLAHGEEDPDAAGGESDDDLDTDLAKAALDTGRIAFEAQDWEEADSLLHEGLRLLQQLPRRHRGFCDIFDLHYRLAVCAYHTQESADAEEALMSLIKQQVGSDMQREYIHNAGHLLSLLYIRMGWIDRARIECEKALQARRRLLGKQSEASLVSTALMAHIYLLLNNRARAKACLAMIPEVRKDAIVKLVEESLGMSIGHIGPSSPTSRSISEGSDLTVGRIQSVSSEKALSLPMENRCYGPVSSMISQSPAASRRPSHQRVPFQEGGVECLESVTVTSLSLTEEKRQSMAAEKERASKHYSADVDVIRVVGTGSSGPMVAQSNFKSSMTRKDVLEKMGCRPRDRIEEAVCDSDKSAFVNLLNKRKDSWRSKFRKRVRPERVTALHFAALFGEIDMARHLLSAGFDINEVPYGYTTTLTPLKFAIGARQVGMVDFLISNGAHPSEQDSWSTLAGQLMNRSWLVKTMSEADKDELDYAPSCMIAILNILLKHGWDVNEPFETSGKTLLHQAVAFWSGSYRWDMNLRAAVTSFMCEQGADPLRANMEGKTPYDLALSSGHQDLLLILDRSMNKVERDSEPAELAEFSDRSLEPAELSEQNHDPKLQLVRSFNGRRKKPTR